MEEMIVTTLVNSSNTMTISDGDNVIFIRLGFGAREETSQVMKITKKELNRMIKILMSAKSRMGGE